MINEEESCSIRDFKETDPLFEELRRVSRRYIVISDPILYEGQGFLSRWFYQMDRGGCFRTSRQMEGIFQAIGGLSVVHTATFRTFPGLYLHKCFVLQIP